MLIKHQIDEKFHLILAVMFVNIIFTMKLNEQVVGDCLL